MRLVSVPGEGVRSLGPTSVMLGWQPPSPAPVMRSKYANKEKRVRVSMEEAEKGEKAFSREDKR